MWGNVDSGNFCFWNPESKSLCFWNPEPWASESAIQLKESGIPVTTGIRNPSSSDNKNLEPDDWNLESTAWDTESKTVSDSLTWRDCCVFLNSGWRLIELFVVGDEVDTVFGFSRRLLPSNRLMELCRGMKSHFHDWIDYHVHFQYRY